MILSALILVALSVMFAAIHAAIINKGKRVTGKWAWAAAYFVVAFIIADRMMMTDWDVIINAVLIRMVFFNLPLNRFRKLPWFYITPELKNVTGLKDAIGKGRFYDYLVYRVFGKNQWVMYAIALAGAVYLTFLKQAIPF